MPEPIIRKSVCMISDQYLMQDKMDNLKTCLPPGRCGYKVSAIRWVTPNNRMNRFFHFSLFTSHRTPGFCLRISKFSLRTSHPHSLPNTCPNRLHIGWKFKINNTAAIQQNECPTAHKHTCKTMDIPENKITDGIAATRHNHSVNTGKRKGLQPEFLP